VTFITLLQPARDSVPDWLKDSGRAADEDARRGAAFIPASDLT
jgi:hypothetical protein